MITKQDRRILNSWLQHRTVAGVSFALDVSRSHIYRVLNKHDIDDRPRGRSRNRGQQSRQLPINGMVTVKDDLLLKALHREHDITEAVAQGN